MLKYLSLNLIFLMLLCSTSLFAQVDYTKQDHVIFENYMKDFQSKKDSTSGELMVETALYFKDRPYVASTLDKNSEERLVVNLRQFDCNTFVETCIALVETVKGNDHSFENFCSNLQNIRYRNGIIKDYSSRMHYVSDWSFGNQKQGIIIDKTKSLGGVFQNKSIDFMSSHTTFYKALKNSPNLVTEILKTEDNINKRNHFYVIQKMQIKDIQSKIKNGDIIAFATSIVGLDYSHVGIAYQVGDALSFIHASTRTMNVVVEPRSLDNYCSQQIKCKGISVFSLTMK